MWKKKSSLCWRLVIELRPSRAGRDFCLRHNCLGAMEQWTMSILHHEFKSLARLISTRIVHLGHLSLSFSFGYLFQRHLAFRLVCGNTRRNKHTHTRGLAMESSNIQTQDPTVLEGQSLMSTRSIMPQPVSLIHVVFNDKSGGGQGRSPIQPLSPSC